MTAAGETSDPRRQNLVLAVLLVIYLASLAFYDLKTRGPTGMPALWPCNALLAAGLLHLRSWRPGAMIAIGAVSGLATHMTAGDPPSVAVIYVCSDMVEAILMAAIVRRVLHRAPFVRNLRSALLIVAAAAPIAALTALVGSALCAVATGASLFNYLGDWASSTILGQAVTLPAALILLDRSTETAFRRPIWMTVALYSLVALTTVVAFNSKSHPMPFLIFPVAMLTAFQLGPKSAAWSALIVAAVAAPLTLTGFGPARVDAVWSEPDRFRMIQAFVITVFFTSLSAALVLAKQYRMKHLMTRRQATARAARARAQAASRAKTEFLATMSHEIRTPLNSILGFAELLGRTEPLSPAGLRKLQLIANAGGSLVTIVNDVLDFSRIEASRVDLDLRPTCPRSLLDDAAAIIAPEAHAKGLTLTVDSAQCEGVYLLDESRLRQVLLNLLNNAVKFTETGAIAVTLSVTRDERGDVLGVDIADTGIGITPEQQERLFLRFSQADSSIRRNFGGTGLGLAICKALVGLMGGEIGVRSTAGEGSTFSIRLPVQAVAPLVAEVAAETNGPAARILLVDDHPMNRELGKALLELTGCAVQTAEDGDEAVRLAGQGGFDVILMDIHMPRMDGLAASRAIRALPGPAGQTPIIALSADVMPHQIERCRRAGMVDHVAKPIERDALYAAINRCMGVTPMAA